MTIDLCLCLWTSIPPIITLCLVSKRSPFWVLRNLVRLILKQKWTFIIVGCRCPQHVCLFLYGSQAHSFTSSQGSWKFHGRIQSSRYWKCPSQIITIKDSLPFSPFQSWVHHHCIYYRSHLYTYMFYDSLQKEKESNIWKHHGNFHPFMFIEQQNALWILDPLCAFNKSWTVLMVKCHCLKAATMNFDIVRYGQVLCPLFYFCRNSSFQ